MPDYFCCGLVWPKFEQWFGLNRPVTQFSLLHADPPADWDYVTAHLSNALPYAWIVVDTSRYSSSNCNAGKSVTFIKADCNPTPLQATWLIKGRKARMLYRNFIALASSNYLFDIAVSYVCLANSTRDSKEDFSYNTEDRITWLHEVQVVDFDPNCTMLGYLPELQHIDCSQLQQLSVTRQPLVSVAILIRSLPTTFQANFRAGWK